MQNIEVLFLTALITVALFLLLREVFCWYFKINQRLCLVLALVLFCVLIDIRTELIEANKYRNEDAATEVLTSECKTKEIFWSVE